jgi:hypothetical protein
MGEVTTDNADLPGEAATRIPTRPPDVALPIGPEAQPRCPRGVTSSAARNRDDARGGDFESPKKENAMIVVRNVFQLKFGKAKEAVALLKEGLAIQKKALSGVEFSTRVLTDVTGPFYTLVLELLDSIFKRPFSMAGVISQNRERGQFLFCLIKNPLLYRFGSAEERSDV